MPHIMTGSKVKLAWSLVLVLSEFWRSSLRRANVAKFHQIAMQFCGTFANQLQQFGSLNRRSQNLLCREISGFPAAEAKERGEIGSSDLLPSQSPLYPQVKRTRCRRADDS